MRYKIDKGSSTAVLGLRAFSSTLSPNKQSKTKQGMTERQTQGSSQATTEQNAKEQLPHVFETWTLG